MIFHITATHNYETCPAHNEEIRQTFAKTLMGSDEKQVKVISTYVMHPHIPFISQLKQMLLRIFISG